MDLSDVVDIVRRNEEWRSNTLNLIASENVMSPLARQVYNSDFMHRYAEGLPFKRYYQGTGFIDELENEANEKMKKIFKANFADVRPVSGAIANLALFSAIASYGDLLMNVGTSAGAHISHEKFGDAGLVGLNIEHFAFDEQNYSIDVEKTQELIKEKKPKIVTLGGSVIQFPHPVKELAKTAKDVGAWVMYDAAHVFGLIFSGEFQQPFSEGADIMTTSTHKTFPGPQGGAIIGNVDDETASKIRRKIFPGILSNHHLNRIPALLVTMLEMEKYGKEYALQTIKNAKTLAKTMNELGFDVIFSNKGYTASHQFIVDVRKQGGGKLVAENLERNNIILNKNLLSWDKNAQDPSGIRIGTQEMTRYGMKESEMEKIASMIDESIKGKNVKREVKVLRNDFSKMQYCLSAF